MRQHMMVVRTLTAAVLFLLLAQANVWASTEAHLVLAVGYRLFLLAAPLFIGIGLSRGMGAAIGLCLAGTVACFWSVSGWSLGVFALGMAVSGYIAKSIATHSSQGAADNKVSLNMGSLVSGGVMMVMTDKTWMLTLSAALLALSALVSYRIPWERVAGEPSAAPAARPASSNRAPWRWQAICGWSLLGVATGIKLTGIFVILPQYLLQKLGALPSWYGSLVILNSAIVILAQHRVLRYLDGRGLGATMLCAVSAMALLALPAAFGVETLVGACLWIALLTVGECALSAYDRIAKVDGYLFAKELMVGVGSFLTVLLSRHWPAAHYLSGVIGIGCFATGAMLVGHLSLSPSK